MITRRRMLAALAASPRWQQPEPDLPAHRTS